MPASPTTPKRLSKRGKEQKRTERLLKKAQKPQALRKVEDILREHDGGLRAFDPATAEGWVVHRS
jgi:hypothetical protein